MIELPWVDALFAVGLVAGYAEAGRSVRALDQVVG
jgi:hypothetical protein